MSNPVCNISSLASACYKSPGTISPKQQKALKIYAKALELKAIGGTDYTSQLTGTLLSDAAVALAGFEQSDRDSARVHIGFVSAAAAGATVPSTISLKQAAISCLVEADDKALDEADVLLTCKLGVHKSYPQ